MSRVSLKITFFYILWVSVFTQLYSQEIEIIKANNLYKIIEESSEKVRVINFWATWCKPCIEELPQFEQINKEENIEVILISLDFYNVLESRVIPFVKKKNLKSKLYLLNESDYDPIINRVNKNWSGAIPATIIKKPYGDKVFFYEKQFKEGELKETIQSILEK